MSIDEARAAASTLAAKVTQEVRALEDATGCKLHALAVDPAPPKDGKSQVSIRVRLEI